MTKRSYDDRTLTAIPTCENRDRAVRMLPRYLGQSSLPSPSNNENIVTKLLTIISANHETPISGSQVNEYLKSEEGKTFLSGYDRTQLLTLQDFLGEKSKIQVITENAIRNFPPAKIFMAAIDFTSNNELAPCIAIVGPVS